MTTLPSHDPRSWGLALDFADMDELVAGLVVPAEASMPVMSSLETSRELVRHSWLRYEFAGVAVTHSLVALELALAARLSADGTLPDLIRRAVTSGLVPGDLAAELDRAAAQRERIATGRATSGALPPMGCLRLVRAVFDAVTLLTPAVRPTDRLDLLWKQVRAAPFPESFRGVDLDGVELILLDAGVAGLVQREVDGGLDAAGLSSLWDCIADLDRVLPLINEQYCAGYYARLRRLACLAAARHLPTAT
ncbi:hypothetical protein ABT095_17680 [Kitasatospora sp. NPDC002227]|uniref:hypothetical protein n=1 Tax=Kitasatospora sp. NPDC002227 TaxID=3154773 RepID=UPI00331FF7E5